jgi:dTDP-L-rhamnose 4-epimerase
VKVLVTGGAGFIGSHLVDALLDEGHEVRVLDSLEPQVHGAGAEWPAWLPSEVEAIRGDVRDADAVRKALEGIEVVFHQGAAVGVGQSMYEIARYVSANSLGAGVLLEAIVSPASRVERMVVASSMSIYGEGAYETQDGEPAHPGLRSSQQLERRDWEAPTSVYAVTKRDHEELFLTVGAAYQIPTVALRYFNVYGSRQALSNPYTGVAAIFSSRLLNGRPPLVNEDGEQTRDFVHVSDIVRTNLLAMRCPADGGRVYNVGTGRPTTIRRIGELLAASLGVEIEPEITGRFRAGDIRHCGADISRARAELGFEPAVRLEEGMHEVIDWVRTQSAEDRVEEASKQLLQRGLSR